MTTFKKLRMKLLTSLAAAAMLFSAYAVPALAQAEPGEDGPGRTEANVTFAAGELQLVSTPNLDFGSTAITGNNVTLTADTIDNIIQVSDLRGTGVGWKLTATLSTFENESNNASLADATITIASTDVQNENDVNSAGPVAGDPIVFTSDNETVRILTAASGTGRGVWNAIWETGDTTLQVPADSVEAGSHVAVINWSLDIAP